ncbi:hypothetical protein TIFTF001_014107 [Ficus carica]|uniref:Uncharacterized protein n=1 Tax=Ficus carica TaxID=3494 RepID=A0AA88D5B3_FICCA|nr:hypothetical protein TIFTF001_014107 [Ficus carica]
MEVPFELIYAKDPGKSSAINQHPCRNPARVRATTARTATSVAVADNVSPSAARRSESRPPWVAQIRRGGVADCPDPAKIHRPQGTVSTPASVAIHSPPPSWI